MSGQYHALAAFVCVTAIALAAMDAEQRTTPRGPASLTKKEMMLGEFRHDNHPTHTHKIRGPLTASISPIGKSLAEVGQTFTLKGLIESSQDLKNVDFKWSVPKGVQVVSGAVKGQVVDLKAGQPVEVQLILKKLNGDNRQIHLVTGAAAEGIRFGDTAQYNTEIQEYLDSENEMIRSKANRVPASEEQARPRQLKVYH